jgi:bacterioferritin-associated ferredoxin
MFVCICHAINETRIEQAVLEGARSVRDIKRSLGLGSTCGKCVVQAAQVIKQTQAKVDADLFYQVAS